MRRAILAAILALDPTPAFSQHTLTKPPKFPEHEVAYMRDVMMARRNLDSNWTAVLHFHNNYGTKPFGTNFTREVEQYWRRTEITQRCQRVFKYASELLLISELHEDSPTRTDFMGRANKYTAACNGLIPQYR